MVVGEYRLWVGKDLCVCRQGEEQSWRVSAGEVVIVCGYVVWHSSGLVKTGSYGRYSRFCVASLCDPDNRFTVLESCVVVMGRVVVVVD